MFLRSLVMFLLLFSTRQNLCHFLLWSSFCWFLVCYMHVLCNHASVFTSVSRYQLCLVITFSVWKKKGLDQILRLFTAFLKCNTEISQATKPQDNKTWPHILHHFVHACIYTTGAYMQTGICAHTNTIKWREHESEREHTQSHTFLHTRIHTYKFGTWYDTCIPRFVSVRFLLR